MARPRCPDTSTSSPTVPISSLPASTVNSGAAVKCRCPNRRSASGPTKCEIAVGVQITRLEQVGEHRVTVRDHRREPGVEVAELLDPVQDIGDELAQEQPGRHADAAAQPAGDGGGQRGQDR